MGDVRHFHENPSYKPCEEVAAFLQFRLRLRPCPVSHVDVKNLNKTHISPVVFPTVSRRKSRWYLKVTAFKWNRVFLFFQLWRNKKNTLLRAYPRDTGSPNVRGWWRGVQTPPESRIDDWSVQSPQKQVLFRFHETILRMWASIPWDWFVQIGIQISPEVHGVLGMIYGSQYLLRRCLHV